MNLSNLKDVQTDKFDALLNGGEHGACWMPYSMGVNTRRIGKPYSMGVNMVCVGCPTQCGYTWNVLDALLNGGEHGSCWMSYSMGGTWVMLDALLNGGEDGACWKPYSMGVNMGHVGCPTQWG